MTLVVNYYLKMMLKHDKIFISVISVSIYDIFVAIDLIIIAAVKILYNTFNNMSKFVEYNEYLEINVMVIYILI